MIVDDNVSTLDVLGFLYWFSNYVKTGKAVTMSRGNIAPHSVGEYCSTSRGEI